ncbi:MATE family efflux transporter [Alkalicella caledoniensis]|uniref:Probable multidrug resistance protein NorM n=1 Tax=Alkalicella caledoniensis TaxID=2731377 RepID=A0A7G9W4S5_ALKCA|nr:MATE family efflux transporter [Alkalicella caledoniensis]QNO13687.1 MATE family efflux transporter [Alkalicella caledoniensis]
MELGRGQAIEVENPRSKVINLAWPAITEMFMATLVQFVDTAMVGQLGPIAISAISLSSSPMWLIMGIFTGVSVGTTALVARYVGANEPTKAGEVAKQSILLGALMAMVITLLTLTLGQYVPKWMGAEPEVLPYATAYLKIMSLTFILHFVSFIVSGVLRGAGDTKTPMRINVFANILNVFGNFFLIFPTRLITIGGPFNIPILGEISFPTVEFTMWGAGLGVSGAAISTAVSRGIAGVIVLFILFSGKFIVKLRIKEKLKFDLAIIKNILSIGLPAALERVAMSSGQLFFTRIVAGLGTSMLAAHHLAIVAESLSYMPGNGFSMAATTLVGQSLGANKPDEAEKYGFETLKLGVIVMSLMGFIFFFFPHYLISIFNSDPEVIKYGSMCLRIVAFAQPFFSSAMVLSGALRGAGDTRWPLIYAFTGMWVVRLSLAVIFVYLFDLGLMGAWLAMVADLSIRGTLIFLRFKSGKWKHIKVS